MLFTAPAPLVAVLAATPFSDRPSIHGPPCPCHCRSFARSAARPSEPWTFVYKIHADLVVPGIDRQHILAGASGRRCVLLTYVCPGRRSAARPFKRRCCASSSRHPLRNTCCNAPAASAALPQLRSQQHLWRALCPHLGEPLVVRVLCRLSAATACCAPAPPPAWGPPLHGPAASTPLAPLLLPCQQPPCWRWHDRARAPREPAPQRPWAPRRGRACCAQLSPPPHPPPPQAPPPLPACCGRGRPLQALPAWRVAPVQRALPPRAVHGLQAWQAPLQGRPRARQQLRCACRRAWPLACRPGTGGGTANVSTADGFVLLLQPNTLNTLVTSLALAAQQHPPTSLIRTHLAFAAAAASAACLALHSTQNQSPCMGQTDSGETDRQGYEVRQVARSVALHAAQRNATPCIICASDAFPVCVCVCMPG